MTESMVSMASKFNPMIDGLISSAAAYSSSPDLVAGNSFFAIKSDSLFIYFYDPEDLFTKGEYRDTNAIPLGQLEKVVVVSGRSAKGAAGVGIQFIPRFIEPSIPKPRSDNNGAVGEVSSQNLSQVAAGTLNQKMTGQVAGVTIGNDNSPSYFFAPIFAIALPGPPCK